MLDEEVAVASFKFPLPGHCLVEVDPGDSEDRFAPGLCA